MKDGASARKEQILKLIEEQRLIAHITSKVPGDAETVIQALRQGGVRIFIIHVAVPQAFKIIEGLSKDNQVVVGAGGVLDGEVAHRAIQSGAKIIDSPCLIQDVVMVCRYNDVLVSQGAATMTEAVEANRMDVDLIKLFPADLLGGVNFLRAIKDSLPHLKFIADGVISAADTVEYLKNGATAVTVAGGIIEKSLVRADNWAEIKERAHAVTEKLETLNLVKNP